jgi:hypothetical protein
MHCQRGSPSLAIWPTGGSSNARKIAAPSGSDAANQPRRKTDCTVPQSQQGRRASKRNDAKIPKGDEQKNCCTMHRATRSCGSSRKTDAASTLIGTAPAKIKRQASIESARIRNLSAISCRLAKRASAMAPPSPLLLRQRATVTAERPTKTRRAAYRHGKERRRTENSADNHDSCRARLPHRRQISLDVCPTNLTRIRLTPY